MIKALAKGLVLSVFASFLATTPALAATPNLSANYQGSSNVQISVNNANSYSQINLSYRQTSSLWTTVNNIGQTDASGYFSQSISLPSDGSGSAVQMYVIVGGLQSQTISVYPGGYSGGCTYNCGNSGCGYYGCNNYGNITLSQTNLNLNIGQSATVTIYNNYNSYNNSNYISSNSNSSVASASVSGNSIYVYANQTGSTTISVCQSGNTSACASLYVTVGSGTSTGSVWFSPSNPTLYTGQSLAVSINSSAYNSNIYSSNAYYISSNSNPNVVSASLSGTVLNLYANQSGSSTITVCHSSLSFCGSLYVTVSGSVQGATNYQVFIYDNYYSPQSVNIAVGSSITWHNSGSMDHTVTFDTPYSDSATIAPGGNYTKTFYTVGTYSYHCRFHSMVGTVIVGNSGSNYNNNLSLGQSSLNLSIGQSASVAIYNSIYNNNYSYYISSNSNSGVASASVSGSTVYVSANQIGSTSIMVCQTAYNACASLYVTVTGSASCSYYGCNNYGNLSLSPSSLSLYPGQSAAVAISNYNNNYYSNSYYISSNTSPTAANATISGSTLNVTGNNPGSTTLTVCQTNYSSVCGSVYITVSNTYSYNPYGNCGYYGCTNYGGGLQYPAVNSNVLGVSSYPNGELVSEYGTVYIVYKNTKTGFVSASVFRGLGFSFGNVLNVGYSGLVDSGYTVRTAQAPHPWGSWIKSGQTVYFVHEAGLIPVPDWNTFLNNGGQAAWLVQANNWDFVLPVLSPMVNGDSRLR